MSRSKPNPLVLVVGAIVGVILFVAVLFALSAGMKSYGRYQKQADARNNVKVTTIKIKNAQQQAKVIAAQDATVKARADQRYIAAQGIKRAQDAIQSTLTPLYVQFEAIEAQKAIATSGQNNTVIYVPAGTNGTPVITQDAKDSAGATVNVKP